jgi:CRISPR-associated endonuclease/helicase Cas3
MCALNCCRLVYIVNRRTVVDQTTEEVTNYHKKIAKLPWNNFLKQRLSTLRGQFADNREWSADPSRSAVIVGTVDMIGSRLLFSTFGSEALATRTKRSAMPSRVGR